MAEDGTHIARIADLERQVAELAAQLLDAQRLSADEALGAGRPSSRQQREIAAETGRADRAEADADNLRIDNARLVADAAFTQSILDSSNDCIKVLGLDGSLQFMSGGGQRVMEVDDFSVLKGCPWPEFWEGAGSEAAAAAVEAARNGKTAQFEGPANTAKGTPRYWEVLVTPIMDDDGKAKYILSISRDVTARRNAELLRERLTQELHHRVVNSLAMVSSIVTQSLRSAVSMEDARTAISSRIRALGTAHALLVNPKSVHTEVKEIVCGAIKPYDEDLSRFTVEGDALEVSSRAGLGIALTINELCTNATKYGALSASQGHVRVEWKVDTLADQFELVWIETGGPVVTQPTRTGFGSKLIDQAFARQLDGTATHEFSQNGVTCRLKAPLAKMRE